MNECNMQGMPFGMERKRFVEDSEGGLHLSTVRVPKKATIADKVIFLALELFYAIAVAHFVGDWAIAAAYAERGYKAYGGEYLLIAAAFAISFWAVRNYLEAWKNR